ncbi:carbohydrate ABC transporter permease [Paenibacillus sp. UMB4589-SE434]|uniref:carbohydrate ABC transporter permease n=1 Tax=Paenibacillus sp. UMB4589-SE434 TaxID=3046314 RepID=UPI00254ED4CA|nr:carbohydrate ABC transporter permease [Paenibacillus sp. UMB4589-SE434]MDK8181444.1 carbohydrate ABC transporter permease [Paenibacillus sp. UMB4589-SE434]
MRDNRMAGQRGARLELIVRTLVGALIMAAIFFPIFWLFISSVKTQAEMRMAVPTFWPEAFAWDNYAEALRIIPFVRFFGNTLVMTCGIIFLQLNVALMAAYAFAKGRFPGRDILFFLVLAAMIIPDQVIFVPVYVLMSQLDWLDTFWALIIPHGASAYGIFLLRQAFKSVNNDVLEAARVDGAGRFAMLYRILLPITMPTVVTLGVLVFISSWNSYFWPLIMTNTDSMRVLTVGIAMLRDSIAGDEAMYFHIIMAASVMCILPIVVIFTAMQKHIVSAMANSTFK